MGASWFGTVMDSLPTVLEGVGKMFPTRKALGVIKSQPEKVARGKDRYLELSSSGRASLYKQQILGMDGATFKSVVETVKCEWKDFKVTEYLGFKMLVESVVTGNWNFDSNVVEEIERNSEGTHFFFYHVKRSGSESSRKYDMAICYLAVDSSAMTTAALIGGMVCEGLLAKDEQNNVYLQF